MFAEDKNKENGGAAVSLLEDLNQEVVIRSMPSYFRSGPVKSANTKNKGLVILLTGGLLMLGSLIFIYFYLFPSSTAEKKQASAPDQTVGEDKEVVKPEAKPETKSAESGLTPVAEETGTITATTSEEILIGEPGPSEPAVIAALDADADGLSDKEEAIFSTDISKSDSDGDTYSDLSEIINFYNPAGQGKISANAGITSYRNKAFSYETLRPSAWQLDALGGDDSIFFKAADGQFIQILSQPNPDKDDIETWYFGQFSEIPAGAERLSGAGWEGVKSEDGLIVYLTDEKRDNIFVIVYNSGLDNSFDYINILSLIIKSFVLDR